MSIASTEKKERVLSVLEVAIGVATPFQLGRLCGMAEQIARMHEEEQVRKQKDVRRTAV